MQFDEFDLHPALGRALQKCGFKQATQIQQLVLPYALEARDILACAPTGTGKTLAFLVPAIQYLLDFPRRAPGFARVLIMTPTRELAYQVHQEIQRLIQFTELNAGVITGGSHYDSHTDVLTKNNDLLVATPGRLIEYLDKEKFQAEHIELLILDEADRMLDMGFIGEMNRIVLEARQRKQTMLFSATLEGANLERFAGHSLHEPERIEAEPPRRERGKITQWIHLADDLNHKLALLTHLLQQDEVHKAIVFVKTKERLAQLTGQLQTAGIRNCWLQGDMPLDKRQQAIFRFRQGQSPVLIATDVAARGLDIDDISHVINYDMPRTADIYVHRIGRTGRAGKKGTAISLVEAHDMAILSKIERYTEQKLKRRFIEGLRPKHKEAKVPVKKKKPAAKKKAKKK
ncbi:ATP-dependent RNA helicase SrmB [Alkalimonas mucilaginosa]|uniref:ATP-dependent RNA helicase SrmB n=1 Tax=Alkalimonas mucilaginosa TaxID=3057676 RepID=A0ABU7JEG5_9GAMM|nr:ATP-dependent RNA helicase SrmB [Alkalimonas sp. MEB004]MEE2024094.1 ATP-dependent RNA helicase SrmB [Alkalimonas sp. MEB004]